MKLRAIHTLNAGPLGTQTLEFKDDWSGEVADKILFSGPNGCGKSSVLRAIATLWSAFGYWMHKRSRLSNSSTEYKWLQNWDGIAIVLEDISLFDRSLILAFGTDDFIDEKIAKYPSGVFVGEYINRFDTQHVIGRQFSWPDSRVWLDEWTEARQKMLVSAEETDSPNVIYLDAEERRWVPARRGIGDIKQEDLKQRWLASYKVSDHWEGQLEASLLAMKAAAPERFFALVKDMNAFLYGKEILTDVTLGENRLKVRLTGESGVTHGMDELSAGEHQVLIQLYLIGRWLERGGIVLIDEPDLYLHPSLIPGFLSRLEQMVADRDGQLLITSHIPDVWNRYEAQGKRILLGATS